MSANKKRSSFHENWPTMSLTLLLIAFGYQLSAANASTQLSVSTEHDMTKPTYGLHGQSGSAITYNDRNGLNLKGTINDIFGPPIKIANGFNNMLAGSSMAGVGSSLQNKGAVLGFDAKLLEALGGANLLKGGLLLGHSAAKTGLATAVHGLPGKKISSIIEVPVKVVAMKDIEAGKALAGIGKVKGAEAIAARSKGEALQREGQSLKAQGMNQVVQGATEGLQNIGQAVQQTAGNAATAFKLLPIILDLPTPGQQVEQQQHQEKTAENHHQQQQLGASLFGGLSSLLPGLSGAQDGFKDPLAAFANPAGGQSQGAFGSLFGASQPNHAYAALLNSTSPLTNLLMNPSLNPFLYPIGAGPFGQAIAMKQPIGTQAAAAPTLTNSVPLGQSSTFNYNLLPGIKVTETMSSQMPKKNFFEPQQHHQQQQPQQPQQQQQQQVEATKVR